MIVLGIHFGHDASVAVAADGVVVNCIERERLTRRRHCIGITANDVLQAIEDAGLSVDAIDCCALTSTQSIEYMFPDAERLSFNFDFAADATVSPLLRAVGDQREVDRRGNHYISRIVQSDANHTYLKRMTGDFLVGFDRMPKCPSIEDFVEPAAWREPRRLRALADAPASPSEEVRLGMHLPVTVRLEGRRIPGFVMSHHFAHAAYCFYSSNHEHAAIFTQDGGLPGRSGYWSGMYYWGAREKLYPVAPHFLSIGNLYERVGVILNLGLDTGAGKLMGLAPYGRPVFFSPEFVGNWHDGFAAPAVRRHPRMPEWVDDERHPLLFRWLGHCFGEAERLGYDFAPLGDADRMLAPINVDIAASTQALIEATLTEAVRAQSLLFKKSGLRADALCMAGGVALNCPANTRIHALGLFDEVFVPPAVHDGGMSMGAALAVTHNILGRARARQATNASGLAFLGVRHPAGDVEAALASAGPALKVERVADGAQRAAELLAANKVIAWYDGRSEIGPRALGHRSILCHPGHGENWARVNRIKGREQWRPFAPAVLEECAADWFEGGPVPSPFMLFTAQVKSDKLPAITHVDGSARIQTVDPTCGEYYRIICAFRDLTGIPVLMNTSFNGPGEPIVETVAEAMRFLYSSELDALLLPGYCVTRVRGGPAGEAGQQ